MRQPASASTGRPQLWHTSAVNSRVIRVRRATSLRNRTRIPYIARHALAHQRPPSTEVESHPQYSTPRRPVQPNLDCRIGLQSRSAYEFRLRSVYQPGRRVPNRHSDSHCPLACHRPCFCRSRFQITQPRAYSKYVSNPSFGSIPRRVAIETHQPGALEVFVPTITTCYVMNPSAELHALKRFPLNEPRRKSHPTPGCPTRGR